MNRMRKSLVVTLMAVALAPVLSGCVFSPKHDPGTKPDPLSDNTTPQGAIRRFNQSYERKLAPEYQGMFTNDFTYEFSNSTDPTLVTQYSTGWFKTDEKESSSHLFTGYTPPGGSTLPAATSIDINLAVDIPVDDNSNGADPVTHKILATRVDGQITVPQTTGDPLSYVITNNYNVFYLIRGDAAASNLDTTQPADANHWYIYRWVDLSEAAAAPAGGLRTASTSQPSLSLVTWGRLKGGWH